MPWADRRSNEACLKRAPRAGAAGERAINWGTRPPATETIMSPAQELTRTTVDIVAAGLGKLWMDAELGERRLINIEAHTVSRSIDGAAWPAERDA